MNKLSLSIILCALLAFLNCCTSSQDSLEQQKIRPRTIITTDGEVDDMDSFVRLLYYSNDLDIKAIVYTSSQYHWKGDGKGTLLVPKNKPASSFGRPVEPKESYRWLGLEWIQDYIDDYADIYDNLVANDPNYPTPEYLKSIVKVGNVIVEGDMDEPTEGSEFIKDIILKEDDSPLYIQMWGGSNTLARALLSIEEQYKDSPEWEAIYNSVSSKVIMNMIQDQDGTYRTYISKNWPKIRTVKNNWQFWGIAYGWNTMVPEPYRQYMDGDWFAQNLKTDKGPLAQNYHLWGENYNLPDPDDHYSTPEEAEAAGRKIHDFISEGDSPTFLRLIDFGLRSLDNPDWGGLGGRYIADAENPGSFKDPQGKRNPWMMMRPSGNAPKGEEEKITFNPAEGDYNPFTEEVDSSYPQTRWVPVLQNDLAARVLWGVSSPENCNHHPIVKVKGSLDITAKAGSNVNLSCITADPDSDPVNIQWWQYKEAGTYTGDVTFSSENGPKTIVSIPADATSGSTIHIIVEATDEGNPKLTNYKRVIVNIE